MGKHNDIPMQREQGLVESEITDLGEGSRLEKKMHQGERQQLQATMRGHTHRKMVGWCSPLLLPFECCRGPRLEGPTQKWEEVEGGTDVGKVRWAQRGRSHGAWGDITCNLAGKRKEGGRHVGFEREHEGTSRQKFRRPVVPAHASSGQSVVI